MAIAILADDLTSAGDGAAPFRRTGHDARILFATPAAPSASGAAAPGPDVTAIDLGTRILDEATAADRTRRAARACADATLLLKTVDSTLRGHVAAEIRAAREGSGRRAVVVAPAFPAEGRTTVGSVQYVRGVPVHESEFARDPVHPVTRSDLTAVLPGSVPVAPGEVAGRLPELIRHGGLFVCSAGTDADLDRIVAAVPRPDAVLWVGSPGLAAALARRCAGPGALGAAAAPPPPARRPLVVVGSANPATRRQLARLRAETDADGVTVTSTAAGTAASLRRLTAPVLTLSTPDTRVPAATARALAEIMAAAVRTLAAEGVVDALVVTGGETAATVLHALDGTGLDLVDEPEPGVARGTLLGGPAPLPVLVKAGGFGDDDTLVRLSRLTLGTVDAS
ncbi:four-carbon acid sugar kinase family protein [Streptomyces solicathayae]|uniref:Four-carbon acid sugar kinase family protein n=2 Tax=Streptomyces TaxID=1883 RepID=A0ABZ0LL37_9ACTN|nr:four-carbon acid sugar kinase family protein [Streptomyces sp. HUAS YS2]WOX20209.1 four-carbon acid sugar kinase family protein [Streptomyces sp. HUAS YS2]